MKRKNILFLLSDEHSFRFMSRLSREQGGEPASTPAFDRLANGGTHFQHAYCPMPLCTPSRMCMLSGHEVVRAGAWGNGSVLDPELPTLPGVLAENGYETCLVGKMHLGGSVQFAGFRHRPYGDLTGRTGHQWEPLAGREDNMRARTTGAGVTEIPESMLQDAVVADETVAFLREHHASNPDQPWFLCASFSRPHFPLTAPKRWVDHYRRTGISRPAIPAGGDAYDHPMSVGMRKGFKVDAISEEEMMQARLGYFAGVSYLDEVVDDLLLRLEHSGLLDDTVIVYTSDHGEMAGEHGVWWKNGWYEACTRVPFIVSTPEQRAGSAAPVDVTTPVSLVDLFPTLCGYAAVQPPAGLPGRDLSPAIEGRVMDERPVFCDALTPRWGEGTEFRMVRLGPYKYVRFRDAPPLFFDLANDPAEQRDLIRREGERSDEANRYLKRMQEIAEESVDFRAAEAKRTGHDAELAQRYPLTIKNEGTSNLFLMPDGRLVSADDPLYEPTVVARKPREVFPDFPG
jgi:choline-sulfatase